MNIIKQECFFKNLGKIGKPLCILSDDSLILYHKGILKIRSNNGKIDVLTSLRPPFPFNFADLFRISQRIARSEPKCAAIDNDGYMVVAHCGFMLTVDLQSKRVISKHQFRKGMIGPLSIVHIFGIDGFDDCLAYGEYWSNTKHEKVCIYAKYRGSHSWSLAYSFPENTVKHIHAIIPDNRRGCVYILTGDNDNESGIWEARNNFKIVQPLVIGKQIYRSCVAMSTNHGLVYATDTPLEKNGLYFIPFSNRNKNSPVHLVNLPGSVIYGQVSGNNLVFSTTVEPNPNQAIFKYLISKKIGAGILDNYSHLYIWNCEYNTINEIQVCKKDRLPMGLCQFGSIDIIANENIMCIYYIGLLQKDGKTELFCQQSPSC